MSTLKQYGLSLLATPLNLLAVFIRMLWSKSVGRRFFGLVILAAGIGIALGGFWIPENLAQIRDKIVEKTHTEIAGLGLSLQEVTVSGRHYTRQADLIAAFDAPLGTPIFKVNVAHAQKKLETLPWVYAVTISRILPSKFHIEIVERQPFARWRLKDGVFLIDRAGMVITNIGLNSFSHLPIVQGKNSHLHVAAFIDMLKAYPVLYKRMAGAERLGDRRWTIFLNHGGAVHLPAKNVTKALELLMEMERDKNILAVQGQAIDLRIEGRLLLRAVPGSSISEQRGNISEQKDTISEQKGKAI